MLNNYYRLCAILPGILLTNTFISGERAEAQREKLQGERIRERIQLYRERKQQERSQRTPQPSTGATGLVYHTLSIGGIKREYYLYTPANIRSNLTDKR
jgi:hypothetical protein